MLARIGNALVSYVDLSATGGFGWKAFWRPFIRRLRMVIRFCQ